MTTADGRASARRAAALAVVAAGHLLLWLLLRSAGVWPERGAPTSRPPLVVRLLAAPAVDPAVEPVPAPTAAPRPARVVIRPPATLEGAIHLPLAPLPEAAGVAPAAEPPLVAAPAVPAASAPAPLVLDLPRGASAPFRSRSPALDDPRSNSVPPTMASRIAGAVGSDRLIEEPLGDGRIRFRKGSDCVEVHPSRDGALDPFNEAALPKLRSAKAC